MNKLHLKKAKLCVYFLFLFIAFTGVSEGHLIVIDGLAPKSILFDLPPDYSTYLRKAIDESWTKAIEKEIGPIIAFSWSHDVGDTGKAVEDLLKRLKKTSESCIREDKPLVILAHSWGTVLAYLALKANRNIHVDKFITLGSPLNSQVKWFREYTEIFVPDLSALPNVKVWRNYWAKDDPISGKIPFLKKNNKQISTDVYDIDYPIICHSAYFYDYKWWKNILSYVKATKVNDYIMLERFNNNDFNHELFGIDSQGGPTVVATNKRLKVTVPASCSGRVDGYFYYKFKLTGDFDIQVDFNLSKWPIANGVGAGIFGLGEVSRRSFGGIEGECYMVHFDFTGKEFRVSTVDTSGKLRLNRKGNRLSAFYWKNGWKLIGSHTATKYGNAGYIAIGAFSPEGQFMGKKVRVDYDNLQIKY